MNLTLLSSSSLWNRNFIDSLIYIRSENDEVRSDLENSSYIFSGLNDLGQFYKFLTDASL